MAFSELVKSFENIRNVMRDFYVYGFKSRADYDAKSARSYDNERRRIESWLGEYMYFRQNEGGKQCFISVDSRKIKHNPFFKALKAKSFTANDIVLHFFLLDILQEGVSMSLRELIEKLDSDYFSFFEEPLALDASTIRKKLAEYEKLGLITAVKSGRELVYSRSVDNLKIEKWQEAISFFAEASQAGVIGSFLEDKFAQEVNLFSYKHHYLLHALESDVLLELLDAMDKQQSVSLSICTKSKSFCLRVLPLKIYVSTQSGRRYVLCWLFKANRIIFCRLDNIQEVLEPKPLPEYDKIVAQAQSMAQHAWGVSLNGLVKEDKSATAVGEPYLEHVELVVRIGEEEPYILQCLEREKRCGCVECLEPGRYRFTCDVLDAREMLPWLRTFIGRIESFTCSNKAVEKRFWQDLDTVYTMYGLQKAEEESNE